MNKFFGILIVLAFAACGGGGNSGGGGIVPPTPTPPPTVTPSPTPTPRMVVWKIIGALEPGGSTTTTTALIQKGGVKTSAVKESGVPDPTPSPIVAAPCDPRVNNCISNQDNYSNPSTQVYESPGPTPNPSATPTVTTCNSETLQYQGSPYYNYMLATQTTSDTCSVTIAFDDGTSANNTIVRLAPILIGCMTSAGLYDQPGGGYSTAVPQGINLDTGTYTTDPTQADFYITGPMCPGSYTENYGAPLKYQLNFPSGATLFNPSTALGILDITSAMYTSPPADVNGSWNAVTSIAFDPNRVADPICQDELNCYAIVKSSGGNYYALHYFGVNAQSIDTSFPGDGTSSQTSGFWIHLVYTKL